MKMDGMIVKPGVNGTVVKSVMDGMVSGDGASCSENSNV